MKLTIKNFQSISSATIEFPVGITAIVGPSNSGKTSTIRAIYAVIKNPSEAKSFIQHGKDKAEVEIETDRMKVKWARTLKESSYEINGVLHQKVGRTNLPELVPDNDFYLDEDDNIVNIQDEWSSLFPLDRTDAQVYKLFGSIFNFDENDSTTVMRKIKEDESETKRSIAETNTKLATSENRLCKINSFLSQYSEEDLIAMRNKLGVMLQEYEELDKDTSQLLVCLRMISNISKIDIKNFDFNFVDDYLELDKDTKVLEDCMSIVSKEIPLSTFDFDTVRNYLELNKDVDKLIDLNKCLSIDIPEVKQFDFDTVNNYLELDKDCGTLISILKEIKELSEGEITIQSKINELKEQLDSIESCPFCGKEMDKEKI